MTFIRNKGLGVWFSYERGILQSPGDELIRQYSHSRGFAVQTCFHEMSEARADPVLDHRRLKAHHSF